VPLRDFARATCCRPLAFPRMLARPGSGSGALNVLFGVLRLLPAPHSRGERLPWGSCALITTSTDRVHTRTEFPLRASVRPRRFSRPRRFTPRSAWRVCFAPQPCPGFSLQGFLPPPEPHAVFPRRCPRVVASRCLRLPAPASRSSTPGPCSPVGVRWSSRRRETPGAPRPSWDFPPPGLSPRTVGGRFRALSAFDVSPR